MSWWTGDGNALDIRGGNNGTLVGGANFAAAQVGQGFAFTTDGDGVVVPSNSNLNVQGSGFTVNFWMKGLKNQSQATFLVIDKSYGVTDSTGWFFQGDSAITLISGVPSVVSAWICERATRECRISPTMATRSRVKSSLWRRMVNISSMAWVG